jgi:LacI family transcriptional regulator
MQFDRVVDESRGFVRVNQETAVAQLIDHMVDQERSHLAFIGSDTSVSTSWERQEAFLRIAPRKDPGATGRVLSGDFTVEWGRRAAQTIHELWPEVNAVICANDLIAFGAMQGFADVGKVAPRDVSISGFDDTLIAQASQLTSVRQPVADMAAIAVRDAIASVGSDSPVPHVTLESALVLRRSSWLGPAISS